MAFSCIDGVTSLLGDGFSWKRFVTKGAENILFRVRQLIHELDKFQP